jgi:hypothetical protein
MIERTPAGLQYVLPFVTESAAGERAQTPAQDGPRRRGGEKQPHGGDLFAGPDAPCR